MRVIAIDPEGATADQKTEPRTLWQRVAQLVDRCVVERSYRGIPTTTLRRSKYDLDRCRRMLHGAGTPVVVTIDEARSLRAVRAVQTRP